jgi:hypothetical protein
VVCVCRASGILDGGGLWLRALGLHCLERLRRGHGTGQAGAHDAQHFPLRGPGCNMQGCWWLCAASVWLSLSVCVPSHLSSAITLSGAPLTPPPVPLSRADGPTRNAPSNTSQQLQDWPPSSSSPLVGGPASNSSSQHPQCVRLPPLLLCLSLAPPSHKLNGCLLYSCLTTTTTTTTSTD